MLLTALRRITTTLANQSCAGPPHMWGDPVTCSPGRSALSDQGLIQRARLQQSGLDWTVSLSVCRGLAGVTIPAALDFVDP